MRRVIALLKNLEQDKKYVHPIQIQSKPFKNSSTIIGRQHVLTDDKDTRLYRQGRRYGAGQVLAVVAPGSLLEQWQVLTSSC